MSKGKKTEILVATDSKSLRMIEEAQRYEAQKLEGKEPEPSTFLESILKSLRNQESSARLSFESNPQQTTAAYGTLYQQKTNLTPDPIIKRITGPQGDDLICSILQVRSNTIAAHGRPRTSRFAVGYELQEVDKSRKLSEDEKAAEKKALDDLRLRIWNCGSQEVDDAYFHPNFSQFLKMITRDGVAFGRFAVEYIWEFSPKLGKKYLKAFRAVDAGTIYRVRPKSEKDQSTRIDGLRMLAELKNERLDPSKFENDEYKYVQVIEGRPVMAFTEDEMHVHSLYPTTNVEYNGYPLTPIDQVLNAITTHINITIHNRMYFQNGRAARGMLVYTSPDVNEAQIQQMRLQYHQTVNSVTNSWKVPIFGLGPEETINWIGTDLAGRDAEFQYLSDQNCRVILSAFQMSPEELPGYAYLSRGTNTQALSEGKNEYILTAARDVGLRPLIYDIQDFFNTHLLPKLDGKIAETHQLVLAGLESEDPNTEATRLAQDIPLHMTYNEVLKQVEKRLLPKETGADYPLNPGFQQVIEKYLTVGQIMEYFFGVKGASKDPRYMYVRDPFWFQYQQLLQGMAAQLGQAQMMAMQAQVPPQGDGSAAEPQSDEQPPAEELQSSELSKSQPEIVITPKRLRDATLKHHKEIVSHQMAQWEKDAKKAVEDIRRSLGLPEVEDEE